MNNTPLFARKLEDWTYHQHMDFIKGKWNSDCLKRSHVDAIATGLLWELDAIFLVTPWFCEEKANINNYVRMTTSTQGLEYHVRHTRYQDYGRNLLYGYKYLTLDFACNVQCVVIYVLATATKHLFEPVDFKLYSLQMNYNSILKHNRRQNSC